MVDPVEFQVGLHEISCVCSKVRKDESAKSEYYPEAQVVLYSVNSDAISRRLFIIFVPSGNPVPQPLTQLGEGNSFIMDGTIYLAAEYIPIILHLLNGESNAWVYLDANDPSNNKTYTKNWAQSGVKKDTIA